MRDNPRLCLKISDIGDWLAERELQEVQALHRARPATAQEPHCLVNQVRGLLAEHGIVAPLGIVDPEFKALIPPLEKDGLTQLETNLKAEGVVGGWNEHVSFVCGHEMS